MASLAAGGAERGDVVEEPVLRFGRQVHQQPLGAPGRRLGVVKTAVAQRSRPVVAQVDADRAALRRRFGAQLGHGLGFEHDDLRLIDFVDDAAGRPVQSVGPGVQAGGQDHGLTDARRGRVDEELVEEPGAHRQRVGFGLQFDGAVVAGVGAGSISPSTTRVKKSMPTARTSGAANGSLMIGSASSVASARAAATIVAVAPTLEARSQLSVSLRAMLTLPATAS